MNIVTGRGNVASEPTLPGSGEMQGGVKGYPEPIQEVLRASRTGALGGEGSWTRRSR